MRVPQCYRRESAQHIAKNVKQNYNNILREFKHISLNYFLLEMSYY